MAQCYQFNMKTLSLILCLFITIITLNADAVFASEFPPCPDSPKSEQQDDVVSDDWHNCIGFFESSGTVYVGEFSNGEFHGTGTIFYASGNKYEGNFKFGIPFGKGVIVYVDGGSKLTCYGHVRRYGVYFCELPAVLRNAFNDLPEMQRKKVQINLREYGYEKTIDGLYGRGTAEALMIFNKKCFDYDLTKSERSNELIKELQIVRHGSTSGRQDDYGVAFGVDPYASVSGCNDNKVISGPK
jgi:hypothetical protein